MESNQIKPMLYPIPFKLNTSYNLGTHILNIFFIILFISCSIIIPVYKSGIIFSKAIFLALGLYFAYMWIYEVVLRKTYLELTEEGITFKSVFSKKKLLWKDIIYAQTYNLGNSTFIGLISKDKINVQTDKTKKYKGIYSMSIPLKSFSKAAEPEKLFSTIFNMVKEKCKQESNENDAKTDKVNERESKDVIIGDDRIKKVCFLKVFNIFSWFVLITTIIALIFIVIINLSSRNFIMPLMIIAGLIIILISGISTKTTRKIHKGFLRKHNGIYIKRHKRSVAIYLVEYDEFNGKEKNAIRISPNMCLIEREKKNILAFYIPKEITEQFDIDKYSFERIFSIDDQYYKLDLGGQAEKQVYGYTSLLIFNKSGQLEMIQLEID